MTTLMFQEIGEAGDAVARLLGHNAELLAELGARLRALDPPLVATIARGSSDCCALYLKYLVEIVSGVPCASIGPSIATLYRAPMRLQGVVSVAISQSGRSPDIVEMQRAARAPRVAAARWPSRSSTKWLRRSPKRPRPCCPCARVLNAPSRRPNR